MSSASIDTILDNDLKDGSQGQGRPSPQDTVSYKAGQEGARDDVNTWADFWYNTIGTNVIPSVSKDKRPNGVKWKEWQTNPSLQKSSMTTGRGTDVLTRGWPSLRVKFWRGTNKGKHLVCVDCDNKVGIKEFLRHCFPDMKSLQEIFQRKLLWSSILTTGKRLTYTSSWKVH